MTAVPKVFSVKTTPKEILEKMVPIDDFRTGN